MAISNSMQQYQFNRRQFQSLLSVPLISAASIPVWAQGNELDSDVVIIGGGLGGCAAALASLRNGLRVTMTEQTDWLGGQLTSQGVPPDEHHAIETHGANRSYREFRTAIRSYYREHYQLTEQAKADPFFNPGRGSVSKLCCEPRVAVAVLDQFFQPYIASGKLKLLLQTVPVSSDVDGDRVRAIAVEHVDGTRKQLTARYFVDATELGELLPLTKTEFVTGSESSEQTGELHAGTKANPANQQAFTVCFAVEYDAEAEHLIDRPREYDFWRDFVPQLNPAWSGKLLDLSYSNPRTLAPKNLALIRLELRRVLRSTCGTTAASSIAGNFHRINSRMMSA